MSDFKEGDEIVCVDVSGIATDSDVIVLGNIYTAGKVSAGWVVPVGLEHRVANLGWYANRFRKVQRKNSRLSLEAFFTVPGGFEESKRAPAKKKTDA